MQLSIGVASPGVHNGSPAKLKGNVQIFRSLQKNAPVGEVVRMAIDRGGCGGKSDGEMEDRTPNMDWIKIYQKIYCQNSIMIILNFTADLISETSFLWS